MKVILTTNIKKLGKIGDLVSVKDGYARNYLIPKGMALRENKKNLDYYEKIKEEVKIKEKDKLKSVQNLMEQIKNLKILFKKEADEKNQLYGSISKKEILSFFSDNNIKIHSDDIIIKEPIRTIGDHEIEINPYVDIIDTIKITVQKN